jgi:phosphocarrier protein HPr
MRKAMYSREVTIQNEEGFHVRPAQIFTDKAGQFDAELKVKSEAGREANAKSMLAMMTLGLQKGARITIQADGPDERQAADALAELVENRFGEA